MASDDGFAKYFKTEHFKTDSMKAYTIGGVPILFPFRAYPSQITMMDKIVKCLNKRFNCLLESPTGSGKSLALLCACLAWQRKTKKEMDELEEKLERELGAAAVTVQAQCDAENYSEKKAREAYLKDFFPKKYEESGEVQCYSDISSSEIKQCCSDVSFDEAKQVSTHVSADEIKLNSTVSRLKHRMNKNIKRGTIFIDESGDLEDFKPIKKYRSRSFIDLSSSEFSTIPKKSDASPCEAATREKQNVAFENVTPSTLKLENLSVSSPCEDASSGNSKNSNVAFPYNVTNNVKPENASGCRSKCLDSPCAKGKFDKDVPAGESMPSKLPKIYFGTRTHKQIEQIIRELKKTPYKDSNITILSSRERTCIHPEASRADNKNEACDELLKAEGGSACKFYKMARTISHYHPPKLSSAFDLEDFVGICKRVRACPYYAARELLSTSDIVFCPYNYLVDPLIRSAMQINLKDSIVVMDEAHNIEDSARDAASTTISLAQLEAAILNLEKCGRQSNEISECYLFIAKVLSNLVAWLKANIHNLSDYKTFDSAAKVWAGDNMIAILNYVELGPGSFPDFQKKFEKILSEENDTEKETPTDMDEPKLLGYTITCLKDLTQTLSYVFKNDLIFIPDYRCVVIKSKNLPTARSGRRISSQGQFEITLNFWCLNPAVAFSDFKDVHSVIVASGTLSPLASFQSELGIPFQLTLEANHVVSSSKMWVGTIGKGPNNYSLNAAYENSGTFAFQDEVGTLIFQVCSIIPYGVLCFFPSYNMMDKLVNRWQQTGMWGKFLSRKVVLCEPRKQSNFVQVISDFYEAIKESESSSESTVTGALLFAVCRGKVSEGLDFADNNARAVITVGIPFPNFKDAQVALKQEYNNMYSAKKQIMTGRAWYDTQAFRALNQALGRCIRHRDDFGALIIVDERFQQKESYSNALSKWIRKEIEHFKTYSGAMSSLNSFAERTGLKIDSCK